MTNYQTLLDAEAAYAQLVDELGQKADSIYKTTGDYLAKRGTPSVGSIGGEWMVLGLSLIHIYIHGPTMGEYAFAASAHSAGKMRAL